MAGRWPWAWWHRSSGPGRYRADFVPGYRLLQEIGSGGFSTVHLGEDLRAGRRVALKLARSRDRATAERFATEAAIGERLVSARGIVGILEHTQARDGRPVLVMPFYDRGSTAALLGDGHRLSLPAVVDVVQEVAQGLDAMHRQHYVHRDISPRNILRSTELGSALADLGCARPFNSTRQPPWTEALTPGYAAPEAGVPGAVQSIASDVYGLAATAWALLTGLPPYGRPPDLTALDLVARYELRRTSQPPPIEPLLFAGVPEPAAQLLVRALDPDPARRPGRVLDLSDALSAAMPDSGPAPGAGLSGPGRPLGPSLPGPIRPSNRPGPGLADATEMAAGAQRSARPDRDRHPRADRDGGSEPSPGSGPSHSWLRRRRLLVAVAVLACFGLSFTAVRLISGPGSADSPGSTAGPTPSSSASASAAPQPGDYGDVAPHDLRIARQVSGGVVLRWTPPTDPDALVVLYRSLTDTVWQQVGIDLQNANGQVAVPAKWSGGRYCFMLVVVVRASRGFTSNAVCLS